MCATLNCTRPTLVSVRRLSSGRQDVRGAEAGRRFSVSDGQVTTVRKLAAGGEKIAVIARTVGWSRPTVYRLFG